MPMFKVSEERKDGWIFFVNVWKISIWNEILNIRQSASFLNMLLLLLLPLFKWVKFGFSFMTSNKNSDCGRKIESSNNKIDFLALIEVNENLN